MRRFEKMLISESEFTNIYKQNVKNAMFRYILSVLIGIVITFWTSFIFTEIDFHYTVIGALIIVTVVTVILLIIVISTFTSKSLLNKIIYEAISNSDWNAVFIISSTSEKQGGSYESIREILLEFNTRWKCDFLPHMPLEKTKTIEEQMEKARRYIADWLNVTEEHVELIHHADRVNVKFHQQEGREKVVKYTFLNVRISGHSPDTLKKMRNRFSEKTGRSWKSMDKLDENLNMVKYNYDVVTYIEELRGLIVDFSSNPKIGMPNLKIIWNITRKCGYSCHICATHDEERNELEYRDKRDVLWNILKKHTTTISEIDFSGGDPLLCPESKNIISDAIDFLGAERVTITTTASGINKLNDEEKTKYLANCELTIDIPLPGTNGEQLRGERDYYNLNKDFINLNRNRIGNLLINVPILSTNIDDTEIKEFADIIKTMSPDKITLIRFMPVGKSRIEAYPKTYNPTKIISHFRNNIDEVYLNCALRVKYDQDEICTMVSEKIGIDCAGNVFACGWAGYLTSAKDVESNPFYLGNLLSESLHAILMTDKARKIEYMCRGNQGHCPIFSYHYSSGKDIFSKADPMLV